MAKNTENTTNYRDIIDDVRKRSFAPIYLLMGEESYYIDKISEFMADNILTEDEKGFNQQTIYCTKDTKAIDIVNAAKRYPVMSEYMVLIIKEAQNLSDLDTIAAYAQNPMKSTVLVICHKNKSVDKRLKLVSAIKKNGVLFESNRLKDSQLPAFIVDYLKRKGASIDPRAVSMLAESVGSDLNRMSSELDKLCIALPSSTKQVTPDLIERNIGISKDFNNFELKNALVIKDVYKANQIINYFEESPKANQLVLTIATLFNFFANLMLAHYAPAKTEQGLCDQLDMRDSWRVREYITAMRNFSAMKTMLIIDKIREADARLKGMEKGNMSDYDIMRELIYFILH